MDGRGWIWNSIEWLCIVQDRGVKDLTFFEANWLILLAMVGQVSRLYTFKVGQSTIPVYTKYHRDGFVYGPTHLNFEYLISHLHEADHISSSC